MQAATRLIAARGVRGFGDGICALLLPVYLTGLGFSALQVGMLTTAMLLGSAALTLAFGLVGHLWPARRLLLAACGLTAATGIGFAAAHGIWPLMLIGFFGTLNPSNGDVSPFLPMEQSLLTHASSAATRTRLFARYGLTGSLMGAIGALSVGGLGPIGEFTRLSQGQLIQAAFLLYGALSLVSALLYRGLPNVAEADEPPRTPLGPSRRHVFGLAALFSLDSFGSGFFVTSMLALWLFHRFGLTLATAGAFFFWTGILTAVSQLASAPLARRIGLIRTMVFTHIPANLCMVALAFAPNVSTAFALLVFRALLSNMDAPARQSYVMATVTPAERAAAAGVTNVPRSLASAISPALAGLIFTLSPFAWPLVIGGSLKTAYDLLLLWRFSRVRPPEEV